MDATWHSGPRGSATRAHAVPTWLLRIFIIYLHSIYNGYSAFRISEGFSNSLFVGSYKPDDLLYSFLCGTNTRDVLDAGDAANRGASDRTKRERSGVDRMRSRTTDRDQRTCFNSVDYNG